MKRLLLFSAALLIAASIYSQSPQKMSYQCVVRNATGNLVTNQSVGLKISIRQGSATGTVVFSETFSPAPQTNANGLVTVEIGSGTSSTGNFSNIDWSAGPYFLETQTDPTGGTNYTISGTSQLLSVPYALYAKSAGNGFSGNYNDLTNKPLLFSGSYNDLTNRPTLFDGTWTSLTGKPASLAGYGITDAMSTTHAANNITTANIINWNAAFGWGNHSGLYRPITYVPTWSEVTSKPTTLAGYGITNAMSTSHPANAITTTNITNWTTAFGWGNHATVGYTVLPTLTNNSGKFLTNNGTAISWGALSTVSTTGSYNDLLNKPTIPQPMPNGSNAGDMLYWNGSAWVAIPVGTAGQILQLSSSKVPTWAGPILGTLSTNAATVVTSNSAVSGGNISSDGGSPIIARGVCWSTSINPTVANNKTSDGSGNGTFTSTITGLAANTSYHVRAYATNSVGTSYGNDVNFNTSAPSPVATIITRIVHGVTSMSAICGGEITSDGGMAILERGVCWSTSPNPTISNNKTSDGSDIGKYDSYVKGLASNTTYYIRAYATNNGGTAYGDEMTFKTYSPYVIGDIYQGGIIFYITGTYPNQHGLVVTESALSNGIPWWNGVNIVTGATGRAVGTGQANTTTIITAQGSGRYAATICNELVLNGYDDWFLPSIDECGLIYNNLFTNGLFGSFNMMWTSTEADQNHAWVQYYQGMQYNNASKISEWQVFAVRAF